MLRLLYVTKNGKNLVMKKGDIFRFGRYKVVYTGRERLREKIDLHTDQGGLFVPQIKIIVLGRYHKSDTGNLIYNPGNMLWVDRVSLSRIK